VCETAVMTLLIKNKVNSELLMDRTSALSMGGTLFRVVTSPFALADWRIEYTLY